MSNNKMKNLFKGLRYISHIFENEKEGGDQMEIGFPTDVKHVAHIGPYGASINSPSWMNGFKSPGFASAPLSVNGDLNEDSSVKWASQELPRSSRRHSSGSAAESPTREKDKKPEKPKQSRRSSWNASKEKPVISRTSRQNKDPSLGNESPSNLPDIPKKSRRKKSRDSSIGGGSSSTRSSRSQASEVEAGSESGSVSKTISNEQCHTSALCSFEDGQEKGFPKIS